ncbi:MAG TPA: TadE/TadG family type IV pilus assembly protein [Bryobacteraceae bacterium]|jgi:Flp pilus assembly protein TadG
MAGRKELRGGQATVEFALLFVGVLVPFTFGILYVAQLLWVWHSMVEFTRDGARYATTHCWQSGGANVLAYMYSSVPPNIEQAQFNTPNANATLTINYYTVDPDSGTLTDFSCDSDCSITCVPDVVSVSIQNYIYTNFFTFLNLPGVQMPSWLTTLPMESAGCDPSSGVCNP